MSRRIGGYAAIAGGILWLAGFLGNELDGTDSVWPAGLATLAGTAALLVALAGLSASEASRAGRGSVLVWAAFALPALGTLLSIGGIAGMAASGDAAALAGMTGWEVWFVGTFALIAGSGLFAMSSWRGGSLSRLGCALLGAAAAGLLALLVNSVGLVTWQPLVFAGLIATLVAFAAGWVVVGLDVVRSPLGRSVARGGGGGGR